MNTRHEKTFHQREYKVVCKYLNLISLATGESTVRYHYTSLRATKIKNSDNTKRWWKCRETRVLMHRWWECKMVQQSGKQFGSFFKNLSYDPGHLSQRKETCPHKNMYTIIHSHKLETTKMSYNQWMVKQTVVNPYRDILCSTKKE